MNPAIETNSLMKRYGNVTAVDGLSLRMLTHRKIGDMLSTVGAH